MPALPRVDRIKPIYSAAKGLNYAWRFTDFLKTPNQNGVSRYVGQLHRITFRFCKQSEASVGMRNFIETSVSQIGSHHPSVVIYGQPVRNTIPLIRAEYGNGRVIQVDATNLSESEIMKDVQLLLSRSGEPIVKLESRQSSAVPSLQGEWTPFTWMPTEMNVAVLPDAGFSTNASTKISATDYVLNKIN